MALTKDERLQVSRRTRKTGTFPGSKMSGKALQKIRIDTGLTQKEMAALLKLHPVYYGGFERGEVAMNDEHVVKVKAIGADPEASRRLAATLLRKKAEAKRT